jgi:hypothetical protein
MTFGLRACTALFLLVTGGLIVVMEACSSDPTFPMLGADKQACFMGGTCNPGLTCLVITTDGGFTDGGQCVLLEDGDTDGGTTEAGDAMAEGGD